MCLADGGDVDGVVGDSCDGMIVLTLAASMPVVIKSMMTVVGTGGCSDDVVTVGSLA